MYRRSSRSREYVVTYTEASIANSFVGLCCNNKPPDTLVSNRSVELEEVNTHRSAKTHAGNVFVTRDLDL